MVATVGVGLFALRDKPAPTPPPVAPAPAPTAAAVPPADGSALPAARPTVSSPAGVRPCKVTREGAGPVADACRRGGHDAARTFMKKMVNRSKTLPERVTCDTCHENIDDFTLQEGARGRLAELLPSLGPPAGWAEVMPEEPPPPADPAASGKRSSPR